ncbi:MAG: hypothetical protein WCT03_11045 [Candidatus Obscuribacterales bacterium]
MKKTTTVLALLVAASGSICFAGQAFAGKQGSNTSEEQLQAYLFNLYLQQQQSQRQTPPQETPPPPAPPTETPSGEGPPP